MVCLAIPRSFWGLPLAGFSSSPRCMSAELPSERTKVLKSTGGSGLLASDLVASDLVASDLVASDLVASDLVASDLGSAAGGASGGCSSPDGVKVRRSV